MKDNLGLPEHPGQPIATGVATISLIALFSKKLVKGKVPLTPPRDPRAMVSL